MNFKTTDPLALKLRRVMRARDYFTLAFGSIIGVGWMIVINDWLKRGGPMGAMLAYLIVGIALIPVVYAYGRLAEHLPQAGSEVVYTSMVFPRSVSFATGWAMTLAYLIVCPFEAVAIGEIAARVFPPFNTLELYQIGEHRVYLPQLLLGLGLTIVITVLNYRGIVFSTAFQNLTTFGLLGVFAIFATLGFWKGSVATLPPLFAGEPGLSGALLATLAAMRIVPYFLTGFETIPKCSEEASTDFNPRGFFWIMLLALGVATFFYVAVVGVVAMLQPWPQLTQERFATITAFRLAFGWEWLVQLILFGAMLSLLKVFNGNFLAATRLLYAMGKRGLLGPHLGTVDQHYQTPSVAIGIVGLFTAVAALFGRAVLDPIAEVGSLACSLGWLATCLAFCWGAGGKITATAWLVGSCGAVVSAALVVLVSVGFGAYEMLAVGGWVALGLVLWLWQLQR